MLTNHYHPDDIIYIRAQSWCHTLYILKTQICIKRRMCYIVSHNFPSAIARISRTLIHHFERNGNEASISLNIPSKIPLIKFILTRGSLEIKKDQSKEETTEGREIKQFWNLRIQWPGEIPDNQWTRDVEFVFTTNPSVMEMQDFTSGSWEWISQGPSSLSILFNVLLLSWEFTSH